MNDLLAAVALLTIAPIRRELNFSARALLYFPLVGAALAGVLVLAQSGARLLLPPFAAAALVTALWGLATGALHLDGASDAGDALLAETTRERRLEILRDVHLGAFGATTLILLLLLKFAALADTTLTALFLAPILARWALVYAAAFPLARSQGMAALFAKTLTRREIAGATLLTFLLVAPFGWLGAGAWLGAVIIATLLARLAMARLGGLTGDIYGLICESVEVSVLFAGLALAKA